MLSYLRAIIVMQRPAACKLERFDRFGSPSSACSTTTTAYESCERGFEAGFDGHRMLKIPLNGSKCRRLRHLERYRHLRLLLKHTRRMKTTRRLLCLPVEVPLL